MTKTLDQNFIDWEANAFGYGYGTGEPHIIPTLKTFMDTIGRKDLPTAYDYQNLEAVLGPAVAWLLINTLCHVDIIDYGSSPRFGWLTNQGITLKEFISTKTVAELIDLCCERDENYIICYPNSCNCGPEGYDPNLVCHNPFWKGHS